MFGPRAGSSCATDHPPSGTKDWGTTTVEARDPCHGAAAVSGMPLAPAITARLGRTGTGDASDFKSTPTTPVTWRPPPYRGASGLTDSDGHGAAQVEDREAVQEMFRRI